jgi:hypothetical protein
VITFTDGAYVGVQGTDCTANGSWSNYSYNDPGGMYSGSYYTLCGSLCFPPTLTAGY